MIYPEPRPVAEFDRISLATIIAADLEQSGFDGLINEDLDCACLIGEICSEPQPDTCFGAKFPKTERAGCR